MSRYLPLLVIIGFFAEFAWLLLLASRFGVLVTIASTAIGFIVGGALVRRSGTGLGHAFRMAQGEQHDLSVAAAARLADLVAGLLFIVPGLISDLAAIALLLPVVRRRLARSLAANFRAKASAHRRDGSFGGPIIDGQANDIDDQAMDEQAAAKSLVERKD